MLVGRTFSYSDTQRYRVGPNYLQLPVNQSKHAKVSTNQRDGQMTYFVDGTGENPHVNYEPSVQGGLGEADAPGPAESGPVIEGRLTRARIPRTNDYKQAAERWILSEDWEKDDLVANLGGDLATVPRPIQERMMWHLYMIDDELGHRISQLTGITADDVRDLGPLRTQTLTEEERRRAANLGHNGPREAPDTMTHCVPNERDVRARDAVPVAGD